MFLDDGVPPAAGKRRTNPAFGETYRRLAACGLDDFYRGRLAAEIVADLSAPVRRSRSRILRATAARLAEPLSIRVGGATLFNHPPPTQGFPR